MDAGTTGREYTIKEAAALTGLPASTLRYYESSCSRPSSSGSPPRRPAQADQAQLTRRTLMQVNAYAAPEAGSMIGGIAMAEEMQDVCAEHVRYRFVIDASTI